MFWEPRKELQAFCTARPDLQAGKVLHFLFPVLGALIFCLAAGLDWASGSGISGLQNPQCIFYQSADTEVLPDPVENPAASYDSACTRSQNRRQTRTVCADNTATFWQAADLFIAVRLPVQYFRQHFCCTALQHINSTFSRDGPWSSLIFSA